MAEPAAPFLEKAMESLDGAMSEYQAGRYNNAANRCYYACFQAGIAALQRAGVAARAGEWGHEFVPSQFEGLLIYRRKLYPAELRGTLTALYGVRVRADYEEVAVSSGQAARALRRACSFVAAIERGG